MRKNIKYLLLLAVGFFWCSGLYLTQEQVLLNYLDSNTINLIDMCIASLSMALGILLFIIFYKKKCNLKKTYLIFLILCFFASILFFIIKSSISMSVILCCMCLMGAAGFGIAYHLSLVSSNVEKKYQGRVFGFGYALGAIALWVLSIIPGDIYKSSLSLLIYLPFIILNFIFIMNEKENIIIKITKKSDLINIKYFALIVLLMSITSSLSNAFLDNQIINLGYNFSYSRVYYAVGLIIVGFLADKKKNLLELFTIISLFYPLLTFIFIDENIPLLSIYKLSYVFLAFLVVYRINIFTELSEKGVFYLSALGLMISRIVEGILTLLLYYFKFSNLTYIISIVIFLASIIIIVFIHNEEEHKKKNNYNPIKDLVSKYGISSSEEKVLELLMQNYNNQEIADKLFISVNTVRNHIANIYKKTNMKKKEIKSLCYKKTI